MLWLIVLVLFAIVLAYAADVKAEDAIHIIPSHTEAASTGNN